MYWLERHRLGCSRGRVLALGQSRRQLTRKPRLRICCVDGHRPLNRWAINVSSDGILLPWKSFAAAQTHEAQRRRHCNVRFFKLGLWLGLGLGLGLRLRFEAFLCEEDGSEQLDRAAIARR